MAISRAVMLEQPAGDPEDAGCREPGGDADEVQRSSARPASRQSWVRERKERAPDLHQPRRQQANSSPLSPKASGMEADSTASPSSISATSMPRTGILSGSSQFVTQAVEDPDPPDGEGHQRRFGGAERRVVGRQCVGKLRNGKDEHQIEEELRKLTLLSAGLPFERNQFFLVSAIFPLWLLIAQRGFSATSRLMPFSPSSFSYCAKSSSPRSPSSRRIRSR